MIPVFDSNIVIDLIASIPQATEEYRIYSKRIISSITWIEVLAGIPDERAETVKAFLRSHFTIVPMDDDIIEYTCFIRRKYRSLKLPDAIIWATALQRETLLVTRNSKDFAKSDPSIRIPYTLKSH